MKQKCWFVRKNVRRLKKTKYSNFSIEIYHLGCCFGICFIEAITAKKNLYLKHLLKNAKEFLIIFSILKFSGFLINHLDVAPYFSGTIYGIISGLASVNSWLAPLVVASLTEAQVKKKKKKKN